MQFRKVAETSENAPGPRSSVSLWRKYLNLYTVKLQVTVRLLLHCGQTPCMRMKAPQHSILAHTTTFSSPSSVACVQLGTVTLNCHPWPAILLTRTGCTKRRLASPQQAARLVSHITLRQVTGSLLSPNSRLRLLVQCNTFQFPVSSGRGATEGPMRRKNNESWWKAHSMSHLQSFLRIPWSTKCYEQLQVSFYSAYEQLVRGVKANPMSFL